MPWPWGNRYSYFLDTQETDLPNSLESNPKPKPSETYLPHTTTELVEYAIVSLKAKAKFRLMTRGKWNPQCTLVKTMRLSQLQAIEYTPKGSGIDPVQSFNADKHSWDLHLFSNNNLCLSDWWNSNLPYWCSRWMHCWLLCKGDIFTHPS